MRAILQERCSIHCCVQAGTGGKIPPVAGSQQFTEKKTASQIPQILFYEQPNNLWYLWLLINDFRFGFFFPNSQHDSGRGGTVVVHLPSFILEDELRETFRGLMEVDSGKF